MTFPYKTVLLLVLRLVNTLSKTIQEKRLLDAGAAQEVARTIAETSKLLGIGKQIVDEIEKMSDDDLDNELRKATGNK